MEREMLMNCQLPRFVSAAIAISLFAVLSTECLAQGMPLTKEQWAQKMIKEQSVTGRLCKPGGFLLSCFSPRTKADDPADQGKTLGEAECVEATQMLAKTHLADGSAKSGGQKVVGMFFNRLPVNLNDYNQKMYDEKLAKEIMSQIVSVLNKQGAMLLRSPACDRKLEATFPR